MALVLNEEQQLLRDSAKSFLQEKAPVSELRRRRDEGTEDQPALWSAMAEMGWSGITIAEEFGGLEFGHVGAGLLMEECGRTLAASPLLSTALVGSSLVAGLGSQQQKEAILPAVSGGELVLALAVNEGPRTDPAGTATTAEATPDGFVLNGTKTHVIDANTADKLLVVARTSGERGDAAGLSVFLVDRDAAGISISSTLNVDSQNTADIRFDSVQLASDALLGDLGEATPQVLRAMDIGAAGTAAELLGTAQEAFERTLDYLRERKQFGVFIGSFQALQHRAAELFCEIELTKSAVLRALQALDEDGDSRPLMVSLAKAKACKTAQLAVNEAVQMHGGIGMTDEFDVGFFIKRAAVTRQQYGDYYYHADRFARIRGY